MLRQIFRFQLPLLRSLLLLEVFLLVLFSPGTFEARLILQKADLHYVKLSHWINLALQVMINLSHFRHNNSDKIR